MANIEAVKKVVTFKLELNEKELGTIVSAIERPHSTVSEYARSENLPHLDAGEESNLFDALLQALKDGAK